MDTSRDKSDIRTRAKAAYDETGVIWPETDRWSTHTRDFIDQTLRKFAPRGDQLILNAGCGGNDYGLGSLGNCVNLDISFQQSRALNMAAVGDIETLPFETSSFDLVICVGAVVNYCEPYVAIPELARVLKAGGLLFIDFETTTTAEVLFSDHWGRRVSVIERLFADRMDKTYLFSPYHVKTIVKESRCDLVVTRRYHTSTAIWRRMFPRSKLPNTVLTADRLVSAVPGLNVLASNIIFVCRKR